MQKFSNDVDAANALADSFKKLKKEIARVIIGQDEVVRLVLTGVFCQGHSLLVGVPGLAKTLLVQTIANALDLQFKRIQFTPDLMPSDIVGAETMDKERNFHFVKGPVFANIVLADEINRTPPKTQAALLESMQEYAVTIAGLRYELPRPFFVLATQNPIEQEGTYPLPEAQLDRFMFKVVVGYPSRAEELEIMKRTTSNQQVELQPFLNGDQIVQLQQVVRQVVVADHVFDYAADLVRATRPRDVGVPKFIPELVSWGAGPRASQYLILGGKARAILHGRLHVTTEDIREVAYPVLRHRLVTTFNADAEGVTTDDIITRLIKTVPLPQEE